MASAKRNARKERRLMREKRSKLITQLRNRVTLLEKNHSRSVIHDVVWVLDGIVGLLEINEMEKIYNEDNQSGPDL